MLTSFEPSFPSYHNNSCLVVGQHDRDETGIWTNHSKYILYIHTSCHLRHEHKRHICDRRREAASPELLQEDMFVKKTGPLPALPSFCKCSAASLIESCSTLEVMMWGRSLLPFIQPSPAVLQFLLKCSKAVCSTRLLACQIISLT